MDRDEVWQRRGSGRRPVHHLIPRIDAGRGHVTGDDAWCWCSPEAILCSDDNETVHIDIEHVAFGRRIAVVKREAT